MMEISKNYDNESQKIIREYHENIKYGKKYAIQILFCNKDPKAPSFFSRQHSLPSDLSGGINNLHLALA